MSLPLIAELKRRRVFRARVSKLAPLFAESREATPDWTGADHQHIVFAFFVLSHQNNTLKSWKTPIEHILT